MKVVIYARYSSDKQGENTIEAQIRYCTEYCERNNHTIVGQYVDRATSASKNVEKRLEFQKMIRDSEKHTFEGIVVFKLDRFARNRYDSATYKNRLKKNGVQVLSATENLSGEKESIILEAVLEGMAEYFSKDLAEKVTSGMREVAMKCQSNGGPAPLGYKIVDKKYVIDTNTAPIVKEAFERYTKGEPLIYIIDDFNRRGFKTSKGGNFNKNSFHNMFVNEKYIGVYTFQDIRIENGVPAIIDKDTFDKVQLRMKNRKRELSEKIKTTTNYMLSNIMYCGKCGEPMHGESGTSDSGKVYYYYKCYGNKKNKSCNLKPIRKDTIENEIFSKVIQILTPENINKIADVTMNAVNSEKEKNQIIPALNKQITETNTKIENVVKALESYQSDTLISRLKELEANKKALIKELELESKNELQITKEMIVFYFNNLLSKNLTEMTAQKILYQTLIDKILVLENGNIDIKYNLESLVCP